MTSKTGLQIMPGRRPRAVQCFNSNNSFAYLLRSMEYWRVSAKTNDQLSIGTSFGYANEIKYSFQGLNIFVERLTTFSEANKLQWASSQRSMPRAGDGALAVHGTRCSEPLRRVRSCQLGLRMFLFPVQCLKIRYTTYDDSAAMRFMKPMTVVQQL